MTCDSDHPPSDDPEPRPPTRRQRARREAIVGAVSGALWGVGLWYYFDPTGSPIPWVISLALGFAILFHNNEWQE